MTPCRAVAWAVIDAEVQVVGVLTTLCSFPPIARVSIDRVSADRWCTLATKEREITGQNKWRPQYRGDDRNKETHIEVSPVSTLSGIRLLVFLDSLGCSLSDSLGRSICRIRRIVCGIGSKIQAV